MKQIRFSRAVLIPLLSAIALPVCGALRFDGINDYVTFGPAPGLGVTNFTIECWFKRQGAGVTASTGTGGFSALPLVTKGRGQNEAGVTNMNYFLGLSTSNTLSADFEDKNNGLNHPVTNSIVSVSNSWQHAAVTYNVASSNWIVYLNGLSIRTNIVTGSTAVRTPEGNSIQHAALASALTTTGTPEGYFNGSLDEVRIWNTNRSASQIAANKDVRITSASGLIGRWPLTEISGTTAGDTSGSGINGTLTNGPVWTTDSFDTNGAPTVTITSPANNATVNTNFTITAVATDDGTVTNVYFYDGNTLLGSDTSSPYSYAWNSAPLGAHALKAVTWDNIGLATTSAVVNVTVIVPSAATFTETFDSYADGTLLTNVGGGSAWGPAGIQYEVLGGGGVNGSAGLSTDISGSSIFNWKAHTFQWSTLADGTKVAISLDFQSSPTGTFDDDRVGWTITPDANTSTGSQLALQLDTSEGGMVFYHNLTRTPLLNALSGIKNSTWYRFHVEFTKLSATNAAVVGTLTELDGSGNPTGTPYVGTIADTSTFSNPPSNTLFTATQQCPSFKNFNTELGNADNATFTITPPTVVEYVIVIGVDGIGSAYVPPLLTTGISNELTTFKRLQAEGAGTLNARVDADYAITLPCFVCVMTSRGVNGAAGHNWTGNSDPSPTDTIALNKGSYVASGFDVAHDNGLRTGLWASKSKFSLFEQSYGGTNGAPDTTGVDNGQDKIDYDNIDDEIAPETLTDDFINQMTNDPFHFVFFHYAEPDTAGHSSGWSTDPSSAYATALKDVDTQIGRIIQMVENSPTLQGKTAIILTTDHGGHGTTHGDLGNPLDYTVPFYVWGPGVTAGGDLYAMNPISRTSPGPTSNPPYTGGQPVRNGDSANLALAMLNLGPIPDSTINSALDLLVSGVIVPPTPSTNLLFGFANVWRYQQLTNLDATNWKLPGYDDSFWPSGPGVLARETCDCLPQPVGTTLVTNENSLTFYFRTHFNFVGNPGNVSLLISNLIDDGAVFYLNGVEIARANMPAGTVTYTTLASSTVDNATDYTVLNISGDPLTNLVAGDNVLAVEVHQITSTSTDIVFGSSLSTVGEGTPAGSGGLSFDGVDDMMTMGVASGLGVTNFTIECWFKQQGPGNHGFTGTGGIGAHPLVTKGQGENEAGATNMNYFFGLSTNNSGQTVLGADFEDFNNGLNHPVRGNSVVPSGEWQHGAVTYNVATATWVLYLNGLPDTNATISGVTNSLMALPRFDSLQHAALGACLRTGGTTNGDSGFFEGVMDEVRIWNYTRSADQILSNYNRQITGSPGMIARWALDDAAGTTATNSISGGVNGNLVNGPVWTDGYPFPTGPVDQPPAVPIPNTPINGATGVTNSPTLSVTVSDPETNNVTVTFYGRLAGATSGPDFTLVALPDTQFYVSSLNGGFPALFTNQTEWIVTNRVARNIQYVTQLGDCVEHGDNGGNDIEWRNATNAMYRLENPLTTLLPEGVPYGIAVGNHDQGPTGNGDPNASTTFYNQYFGTNHFQGYNYYGDYYGTNNDNHFDLFSASGMDFIVIYFEYNSSMTTNSPVLAWANSVLATNQNRRAIAVSHNFLGAGFNATFSTQGLATYNALKGNTNLFLMLCGHVHDEGQRSDTFNGRTVWTVMSDYQGRTNGGSGFLRLYEFSPANNVIHVKTYTPWFNGFETDANSQFDIPYNMSAANPFTAIATNTGVASGSISSAIWEGLLNDTAYDWYVTVSDGNTTTTSSIWQFTTGNPLNTAPTISSIANQTVNEDTSTGPVGFVVGDGETAAGSLILSKSSSDSTLVPTNNIVFGGSGSNRTVTVTPATNQSGVATITVTVSDGQASVSTNFTVTVNATNDAPTITGIGNQTINLNGTTGPLNFTIGDAETAAGSLTLGKASSNTTLVPTNNIVFGGANSNRTVTVTPVPGQSGFATITVSVSDGQLSVSNSFVLTVTAQPVGTRSFTNTAAITISPLGNATPYPSSISVSNMGGTISNVTVMLRNMNHTYPADIDVLLVSPTGQKAMIFSDVGGSGDLDNVTVTLSDAATLSLTAVGQIVTGTYKPTDVEPGETGELDTFSAPAPGGPYAAPLSTFTNQVANGTWSLYVVDDGPGDEGDIAAGWSLTISTVLVITNTPPVANNQSLTNAEDAQLAITLTGSDPEGSNLTYTITSSPTHGSFSGTAPNLLYKPVTNYNGPDGLSFVVSDGSLTSAVATVSLTITPVNDAPIASNTVIQVNGDVSTSIGMSASDPEGNAMTFALGTLPTHGLLSNFNSNNGTMNYTPAHGYTGADSLTFTVSDGIASSPSGTLTINVLPLADVDADNLPDSWEVTYSVTNPNADTDGDGMLNWQEYAANTNPTNAASVLRVISTTRLGNGNVALVWKSVGGTRYRVGYRNGSTGGGVSGAFTNIVRPISVEMDAAPLGTDSTQSFTDDFTLTGGAPANNARYYHIEVVE